MEPAINPLLTEYLQLLAEVDQWYQRCSDNHRDQLACDVGCSGCCRGLFDITLLDAALLQQGFRKLSTVRQQQVLQRCQQRLSLLQLRWPEFSAPYILNDLADDSWQAMPEGDETPCPLLDEEGCCLVYEHRPLTCRLHGVPNVDLDGEVFSASCCTLNFTQSRDVVAEITPAPFRRIFQREGQLIDQFNQQLIGDGHVELDTFIPTALLIDFRHPRLQAAVEPLQSV